MSDENKPVGVFITLSEMHQMLTEVREKVDKSLAVRDKVAINEEKIADHEKRIRELYSLYAKITAQVAAIWIITTLVVGGIGAVIGKVITGG